MDIPPARRGGGWKERTLEPFFADHWTTIYQGDCLEVLPQLPVNSVHTVCTSPPYWGLRTYLPDGDPLAVHELGSEAVPDCLGWATGTPCGACWVCRLVAVFREVRRVLRDDGTLWLNCGSAYQEKQDLLLPARLALALQADGWWLRAECIWHKINVLPESVRDRPVKSHEQVYLLTKAPKYFYDAEAVKEVGTMQPGENRKGTLGRGPISEPSGLIAGGNHAGPGFLATGFRTLRSVWALATEPLGLAHFAAFPAALVRRCLQATCPAGGVCAACGTPTRRVVAPAGLVDQHWAPGTQKKIHQAQGSHGATSLLHTGRIPQYRTSGFRPGCACAAGRVPATCLDPFAGSGTTLLVARALFLRAIGIELNPTYCGLAASRMPQGVLALRPT